MAIELDLSKEVKLDLNKGITLDLEKGDYVNLSANKLDSVKLRAGTGWNCKKVRKQGLFFSRDVREDVDLDLVAVLEDADGNFINRVYFNRHDLPGIHLDQDDRSGSEGYKDVDHFCRSLDKDNENITIQLDRIPSNVAQIKLAVIIYNEVRKQKRLPLHTFEQIDNAYCKLVDESGRRVLCSVRMGENGGDRTAVVMANLKRVGRQWVFEAAEEYSYDNVISLT